MENYRKLDISEFSNVDFSNARQDFGHEPEVEWIKLSSLVIDSRYQRTVGPTGRRNIIEIATNFDWARFGTITVAMVEGGFFAIVDGMHRCHGALLRGIESVPCYIIFVDVEQQASVFADINARVTRMSPLQLHNARLAAGNPAAFALNEVCAAGGVTICRYPVHGARMKVGETMAVSIMHRMLKNYGPDVLSLSLRCLTKSRDGNPGMIRRNVVQSICYVLDSEPAFRKNEKKLIKAFDKIDFREILDRFAVERRKKKPKEEVTLGSILRTELKESLGIK